MRVLLSNTARANQIERTPSAVSVRIVAYAPSGMARQPTFLPRTT